jgi:hypothetical protein
MKLYVDSDLKVMKNSNDEVIQVSRLCSSTNVRRIDVSRAPVQRSSGSRRFGPVFQQHDGMRVVENTPMYLRMFQNFVNTLEGEERERELDGMIEESPKGLFK